jgi:hypothetical protein
VNLANFSKKINKEDLIRSFRSDPKVFYVYFTVLNNDIKFDELVKDVNSLNEMLGYRTLSGKKYHEDHKYNLVKNVFWNKCGFNDWLKEEYQKVED